MTVQELLIDATYDVLSRTLAPELAQKLTEEIVERARRGMEEGLTSFFGFDMGKGAGRGKQGKGARGEVGARLERRRRGQSTTSVVDDADTDDGASADDELRAQAPEPTEATESANPRQGDAEVTSALQ